MTLKTAEVSLQIAEDVNFLLVQRYDRDTTNGVTRRIHQEDFCQALSIVSANKYQNEGGPGYQTCLDLLRKVARPAVDRTRLSAAIMFNFLIGNMDAHGKNFSLLHEPAPALSPLYDLLSTRIYSELSPRLAMKVDKYYSPEDVFPRHWKRLCESSRIAYPGFKRAFVDMTKRIVGSAENLRDEFRQHYQHRDTFNSVLELIAKNAQTTSGRFAADKGT